MSSHNRDTWPAEEAQARAIVNALGEGWILRNESREPAEWQCWEARRLADGLALAFGWPTAYGAAKHKGPRLEIRGVWPAGIDGTPTVIRTPYGEADPVTSITVDASKPADTIAKDVLRRLVPSFETLYRQARELISTRTTYADLESRTLAAILAAEPGARRSTNSGSTIYLGPGSHGYTLQVSGDSVRFEPFSVDLPVALRILAALHKAPTFAEFCPCEKCGAMISEAQASLSRARADDAAPWCADCCTAALTAQRAHEAEDPHCTCNDCIAALAAEETV